MTAVRDEGIPSPERAWWLRSLLVLQAPRPVFAAFRNDTDEAANARQEPVTAIVFLAGISGILASGVGSALLDDPEFERLLIPFWIVFAGAAQGFGTYWIGGGVLHLALKGLGATGTFRRTRHLLAFAATPLVLPLLLLWPVRLALFGGDLFREGGDDHGAASAAFDAAEAGFALWAVILLALGLRVVHGWSWGRAIGACLLAALVLATVAAAFVLG